MFRARPEEARHRRTQTEPGAATSKHTLLSLLLLTSLFKIRRFFYEPVYVKNTISIICFELGLKKLGIAGHDLSPAQLQVNKNI